MPEAIHQHHRADDKSKVVLPGWVRNLVSVAVLVITGTIATLTWFDNRYAQVKDTPKKEELAVLSGKLDQIQTGQNDMKDDLKDIKRVLYRGAERRVDR